MAEKISVEIGLEGGEDVRKTLEEIVGGVDGLKAAAEDLGQTDVTVAVKAEGADEAKTSVDDLKTAAEELGQTDATVNVKVEGGDEAKDTIDVVKGAAEELGQTDATVKVNAEGAAEAKGLLDPISQTATIVSGSIDALGLAAQRMGARMTRSLGPLGVFARALGPLGIAVGILGGALLKFGDSSADALNKLTVESAKLGLTAQQLDTLQQAFGKLGVAPDALASSLEKLKPLLGGGLMRVGDIVPPDVFAGMQQFIAQLERMPDGIARTKLAIDTLGDALGGAVIAGLQTGTISAQSFASALGGVTPATQAQIVEAAKYQQSLNELGAAWTRLKGTIAPITTPVFNFIAQEINKFINDLRLLAAYWQVFKAAMTGGDVSAAARKAAEDYNKATQAMQQTGQAAQQTGQQAAQAGQTAASGFMVWDEKLGAITQQQAALAQSSAQTGQQAAQAGQTAASGFMVWDEKLGAITQQQAALAQSSAQTGQQAAQAGQQAASAWQTLPAAVDKAIASVTNFASTLANITWDDISGAGVAAWNAITTAIQDAIDAVLKYIGLKPSAPATGSGAPGKARGGLLGGRGTGTSDSNLVWLSRGEYIMPANAVRQPGVLSFLEALRRSGNLPGFASGGLIPGYATGGSSVTITGMLAEGLDEPVRKLGRVLEQLNTGMNALTTGIQRLLQSHTQTMTQVWDDIAGVMADLGSFSQKLAGRASGGLLGGRGTGTSDSNLAWVSRGEHIMPARAVRQPGMLAFLEALRRSGGNLADVLDGMGRFALGGMVPRAIPAFASGGLAGGGSNVTIQFPGLPAISGLRASSDVVDQLHRAAALAQVRSGGRKPSRYS